MNCFDSYLAFCNKWNYEPGKMSRDYHIWKNAWLASEKANELR